MNIPVRKKLAIISSHPIQYNAPLFRLLTERNKLTVKVFYTWSQTAEGLVYDPEFKQAFQWDIPLLDGYEYCFVENQSKQPGTHHFKGLVNPKLVAAIEAYGPDALLVFGWSFQSHLQVLRHFHRKKVLLFRGDSTLLDEKRGFTLRKLARKIFLCWVYRHVDFALYTGKANHAYYQALGLREAQLLFAPHAVDNDRFSDKDGIHEKKARTWRAELGIRETALVFLFAGKLIPKKDPALLVRAFQQLPYRDCRLVLVGNGEEEPALKALAGNDPRILFCGFQNQGQMPVVYRLGDVFVLPSRGPGETWGLAVNEALACSRAVVVSDRCGCAADLVREGENGYMFSAGDAAGLLGILQTLYAERSRLKEMGERSEAIIKEWNYAKTAEAVEQMMVSISEGRKEV